MVVKKHHDQRCRTRLVRLQRHVPLFGGVRHAGCAKLRLVYPGRPMRSVEQRYQIGVLFAPCVQRKGTFNAVPAPVFLYFPQTPSLSAQNRIHRPAHISRIRSLRLSAYRTGKRLRSHRGLQQIDRLPRKDLYTFC